MQIIAGNLKGRRIPFNNRKQGNARVTSGFVKKAAFSILGETLPNLHFLDLFACSGQIGLEAFSRGARVVLNEPDRRRNRFIAGLVQSWGLEDRIRLCARPAEKLIPRLGAEGAPFDVIYLDPPYRQQLDDIPFSLAILNRIDRTSLLTESGVVLVQHPKTLDLPASLQRLSLLKQKRYGDTALSIYKASRNG